MDAFIPKISVHDYWSSHLFGGLNHWDARYFLYIAENGYTFEPAIAFLPVAPMAFRSINALFKRIGASTLLLSAIIVNAVSSFTCCIAMYTFFRTNLHLSDIESTLSVIMFLINPANIFFVAPYTEPLFLLFQLIICTALIGRSNRPSVFAERIIQKSLPVALSLASLTRSNGLLNSLLIFSTIPWSNSSQTALRILLKCTILTAFCVAPFGIHQVACYFRFCTNNSATIQSVNVISLNLLNIDESIDVCKSSKAFHLLPYSAVQRKYWNVGNAFAYWSLRNIPNFIISIPTIVTSVHCLANVNPTEFSSGNNNLLDFIRAQKLLLGIMLSTGIVFVHIQEPWHFQLDCHGLKIRRRMQTLVRVSNKINMKLENHMITFRTAKGFLHNPCSPMTHNQRVRYTVEWWKLTESKDPEC
ncbi:hypothetical protein ACOME3_004637 [Neoechinorhynchus agilis]